MPHAAPAVCSRCRRPKPQGRKTRCPCRPAWEGSTRPPDDGRSQELRRLKRAANPICEHPGCRRPMTNVDHIKPLAEGGDQYSWSNLQSLCDAHHKEKTRAEAQRGKTRPR
ncbi:HNH endonuclease signature motif containing protein [Mycobacterium marinum]|uniref:HNH endonuclease signature motif containing protein n=1 Tax=Mycobacterium marinum TaxID=1781 RepID=UPI002342600E|nr:HNH endonuclease signature motif containing protein [Mycobacterium marinum]MDC8992498.1 HNH endonuclease signature motif containing protein [Mycobacterium marinum]WDZ15798.1 HNH endonuclease signature motif containing protein [Mycobacterium marinum]